MAGNKQITAQKTEVSQNQSYIDKPLKGIYQDVPTKPM
jgi:peptide methionine sulfoxide reductase MsrB